MIKNLDEITISLCDNGFVVQISGENELDRYQTKKMVFVSREQMYDYLDTLIDNANSSI
jgi:hypothetical protein